MGATHIGAQAVITVSESLQSLVPVQEVGVRHGFEGWQEHDRGIFGGRRSKLGEGHPESESESKLKNPGRDPPLHEYEGLEKIDRPICTHGSLSLSLSSLHQLQESVLKLKNCFPGFPNKKLLQIIDFKS